MRLITRSSPLRIINRVDFETNNRIEKKTIETDCSTHNQCVFKFVTISCWNLPPVFQPHRSHTLRMNIYLLYIYLHNTQQHVLFFARYHMRRTSDDLLSAASCLHEGERYISYFLRDLFVTHSSYEYLPIYLQMSRARFSLFFNNECSFTRKIYPRERNRFVCTIKESMKLILRQSREDYRDLKETLSRLFDT